MKIAKIVGGIVAALFILLAVVFIAARFNDGPMGIIPGGPLVSGELVTTPVTSWESERDTEEIEMQLEGDTTSRTTWFLVHEGRGYIPASLGFPPGKTWHMRADGSDATIRIGGKRHPVTLVKLDDARVEAALIEIVKEKYGGGPPSDAGVWFFNTAPRAPANS